MKRQGGYDVIVIGAGVGGLVCSTLLAKAGAKVLLLEKTNQIGGRYGSYPYKGFTLNNFSGLFFMLSWPKAMERIGVSIPWTEVKLHAYFKKDTGEFFYQPMGDEAKRRPELVTEFYEWLGLSKEMSKEFLRVMNVINNYSEEELEKLKTVSVKEFADSVTQNEAVKKIIWELVYNMTSLTIPKWEDASIYYSLIQFLPVMRGEIKLVQPCNAEVPGSMALPKKILDAFGENGGEVLKLSEVEKILVKNGRIEGVIGKNIQGNARFLYEAPTVVGDLKVWDYFEKGLLNEEDFPQEWLRDARRLKQWQGAAIHIWFGLKRKVPKLREIFANEERGVRWGRLVELSEGTQTYTKNIGGFAVHSIFDPSMAPPDKDLVCYGFWLTTEEAKQWKTLSDLYETGMARVRMLFKGFGEDLDDVCEWVRRDYHIPTWSCENYSVYPRPGVKAPGIEGLYFVGDSIEGEGVGGDIAANTGMQCADVIIAEKR